MELLRATCVCLLLLAACPGGQHRGAEGGSPPSDGASTPSDRAADASERAPDAASIETDDGGSSRPSLATAIAALRKTGLGSAADVVAGRVSQPEKKMKLSDAEGAATAEAMGELLPTMPNARKLLDVMPRSTVELVRAVKERGVPREEAERIADFHLRLTAHVAFANIGQLDENHSHVIGRDWPEIDYSGEGTTWQRRMMEWRRHGVTDFRTARSICRYFEAESAMRYYTHIYRPAHPFPEDLLPVCEREAD